MEILMKLKCSPTTPRSSPHPLKNNERLQQRSEQQQQQQQLKQHKQSQQKQQSQQQQQQHMSCLDYGNSARTTPNLDCCNPHGNFMNVQSRCCGNSGYCSTPIPPCCSVVNDVGGVAGSRVPPPAYTSPSNSYMPINYNIIEDVATSEDCETSYEYQEPEENFVSIDDAKIKGFLMKIGQEERLRREEEELRQLHQQQRTFLPEKEETLNHRNRRRGTSPKVVYEIIDLDDEEEREKLKRIKNQAEFDCNMKLLQQQQNHLQQQENEELIMRQEELLWQQKEKSIELQQQQQQQQQSETPTRQSPDISLVPAAANKNKIRRVPEQKNQAKYARLQNHRGSSDGPLRIIAKIELLDSSDEETEATAVNEFNETEEQVERNYILQDDDGNDALVPAQKDQEQQQKNSRHIDEGVIAGEEDEDNENDEGDDDGDDDDDDEDLPLAASSVSCELDCDDDDNNNYDVVQKLLKNNQNLKITKSSSIKRQNIDEINKDIVILASDEENEEFIDEHEEGLELRWEELELGTRGTRNNFECFVCGKKVQSNYNLRRHMMIHTGE